MKLKSYIFQIALAAVGAGILGACEDMLEPTSDYVIYENGSHLTTPADTATSLIGIIYKLQAIGDRTNLLGEVRGDRRYEMCGLRESFYKLPLPL